LCLFTIRCSSSAHQTHKLWASIFCFKDTYMIHTPPTAELRIRRIALEIKTCPAFLHTKVKNRHGAGRTGTQLHQVSVGPIFRCLMAAAGLQPYMMLASVWLTRLDSSTTTPPPAALVVLELDDVVRPGPRRRWPFHRSPSLTVPARARTTRPASPRVGLLPSEQHRLLQKRCRSRPHVQIAFGYVAAEFAKKYC
jgi:hypothetical protein